MSESMNSKESLIRKIEHLLNVTIDNGASENEAMVAMAKAHELMSKHNISIASVQELSHKEPEVGEVSTNVEFSAYSNLWILRLAKLVANYHKCKILLQSRYRSRYKEIIFVGEGDDAEILATMFRGMVMILKPKVNRVIDASWNKPGYSHSDSYKLGDIWMQGFVDGLRDYYEEQNKQEESMALMMVAPESVIKYLDKYSMGSSITDPHSSSHVNGRSQYHEGYREGKSYNQQKLN